MKPIVEEVFEYKGMKCAILLQGLGHRTAYINVIDTDLKFVDYNNIDIEVHGGLTYSSMTLYGCDNGWWIGWDYAHYADEPDYVSLIIHTTNADDAELVAHRIRSGINYGGHVWAFDEVKADIMEVVDLLQAGKYERS